MPLYQSSVLKKFLAAQNEEQVKAGYEAYRKYFLDKTIQGNIRSSKEEQFQEGFLRELFVNVLGYTINPNPNFNLTTELKNIKDAKKTDGAILKEDGAALAVIELKGTDTKDLDKVTDQAFNYKNNQPDCVYVVTSNFEKLRFFIHNAVEHQEFNLFTLNYQQFQLLWLFLQKDNLLGDIPQKVKEESLLEEEKVTKRLYKDYSAFKNDLWNNMCQNHPETDGLELYKKSQKLLDRFLFIFFAEDKGLLPPNSISVIVEQWKKLKELDEYKPLYSRFQKYFGYMNDGFKGAKYEIHAYNGGLFKADPLLDNLTISDEVLEKHVLKLTEYDFDTEVDTNILGHIFEHSLNDIENVRAQLAGEEVDKSKTKRKKDGVFYTPKYITKYIVDNTVGKLCEEKKQELGINEEEFAKDRKGRKTATLKKLDSQLKAYREWLLQLTICDPACGSGAFLNQALEFLMAEHHYVDELESQLLGYAMVFPDVENHILERNIFGVDINEESVEIARLSLWLRTAKKGRKLTSLSNNIKVGNSLIDDPEVAGELAFNWQEQFPTVFAKGGFDVVIGNPPYVRQELFAEIKPALKKKYDCYNSIADLYTYFIELGITLMNVYGQFSFILPNKFMKASYGKETRKVMLEKTSIDLIYDFDDYPVFHDATTYPIIFILSKAKRETPIKYSEISSSIDSLDPISQLISKQISVDQNNLTVEDWTFLDNRAALVLQKMVGSSTTLKDFVDNKIYRGVSTGCNDAFIIDEIIKTRLTSSSRVKKILMGKEVKRYNADFQNLYLLLLPWEYDLEEDNSVKEYLLEKQDILSKRPEVKQGRFNWWCLSRYGSKNAHLLTEPKIIYPRINKQSNFFLDSTGEYSLSDNNFFISSGDKALLALLNSSLIFYYLKNHCSTLQGGYFDFRRPYIEKIPIHRDLKSISAGLASLGNEALQINSSLSDTTSSFLDLLESKLPIDKPSKKLQNWPELDFKGFLAELKKKKVQLSLEEEAEWLAYFNKKKAEANALQAEINRIDKEIDQMVYELYGLTEEEIKIVQGG